jgi:hypothetical protein
MLSCRADKFQIIENEKTKQVHSLHFQFCTESLIAMQYAPTLIPSALVAG